MHRSATWLLMLALGSIVAFAQTSTDCQSLQAIVSELRQLRQAVQTSNAMATRAQIALYRLQRENEAVARAMQRVSDARSNLAKAETGKVQKALEIEERRAASNHSDNAKSQQVFDEVELPRLKAELELLQKQERQARAEEAEAEQQLRDEQTKLDGLNDLLDRYNNALEEVGRK
jgi:hypothetical protein